MEAGSLKGTCPETPSGGGTWRQVGPWGTCSPPRAREQRSPTPALPAQCGSRAAQGWFIPPTQTLPPSQVPKPLSPVSDPGRPHASESRSLTRERGRGHRPPGFPLWRPSQYHREGARSQFSLRTPAGPAWRRRALWGFLRRVLPTEDPEGRGRRAGKKTSPASRRHAPRTPSGALQAQPPLLEAHRPRPGAPACPPPTPTPPPRLHGHCLHPRGPAPLCQGGDAPPPRGRGTRSGAIWVSHGAAGGRCWYDCSSPCPSHKHPRPGIASSSC